MRLHRYIVYSGLVLLSACKTSSGTKSETSAEGETRTGASGTRKSFYTGYHAPSRQYLYHICIVPKRALVEDSRWGRVVDPRFLTPDLYVNTMNDPNSSDGTLIEADGWTRGLNGQFVADYFTRSGNASASVSFMKDASASDIMNKVAGGLDVKMNITGGSVSGGAEVSMNSAASNRATTMTYIVNLKAESLQVIPDTGANPWVLTPYGEVIKNVVATLRTPQEKIDFIASNCGTHYLAQVDFGATFVASLKIATSCPAS
jgi:hypothetical protein